MSERLTREDDVTICINSKMIVCDTNGNWIALQELTPAESKVFHEYINTERLSMEDDELINKAIKFANEKGKITSILLQLEFTLGYKRANRIMKQMEDMGILDKENHGKFYINRTVVLKPS